MIPPLPSPLPSRDLTLLQVVVRIAPEEERHDWLRCWRAELWHRHHPRAGVAQSATDLYWGFVRDAIWLRKESLRRAMAGTAALCLIYLSTLALLVMAPLIACLADISAACHFLARDLPRFGLEAILTSIVGFMFTSQTTMHLGRHSHSPHIRAYLFGATKLILLQVVAYLMSLDITLPFHERYLFGSEILQPQIFALIALLALRWGFEDHGTRCRHCLRSLSAPLRIGRPSWNFIDSNGTQLRCPDGHGVLSVPEIETSWRESSEWLVQ